MANVEMKKVANTDSFRFLARKSIAEILRSRVFKYEMIDDNGSLAEAEKLSEEGYSIIVAYSHADTGEPPRAAEIVIHSAVMGHKKIITPIAQHMDKKLYHVLGKIIDVTFETIVTDNSVKNDSSAIARKGNKKYLKVTTDGMGKGKVILLAPQQERLPYLGKPKRAVRAIMDGAEEKNYKKYAFLIIGFDRLNNSKYAARVGACLTREQVLEKATIKAREVRKNTKIEMPLKFVLKFVDEVIFEELRKVVPDDYK